ncbi:unnamed protein product [Rotaria sp. Silwood2]|nr:unnamed protein product [Rotaria sp. Silwood2]
MLSNIVEDGDKIVQCLNSTEKLQLIPYFDLGMEEGIWVPRVSKSFVRQHHTCRSYDFPKHIIEQQQKPITQLLQHTTNELHWYPTNLEQNAQQRQPFVDPPFYIWRY